MHIAALHPVFAGQKSLSTHQREECQGWLSGLLSTRLGLDGLLGRRRSVVGRADRQRLFSECSRPEDWVRRRVIAARTGPRRRREVASHRAWTSYLDVLHQAQRQASLALQRRERPPSRQGKHFYGPENGNRPFHGIAHGMAFAANLSL